MGYYTSIEKINTPATKSHYEVMDYKNVKNLDYISFNIEVKKEQGMIISDKQDFYIRPLTKGKIATEINGEKKMAILDKNKCLKVSKAHVKIMPKLGKTLKLEILVSNR